jgi:hypothetical protein
MTVIMEKSACFDCIWNKTCQKLERLNGSDNRDDNREKEIFELIIKKCSLQNYDRSNPRSEKIIERNNYTLYYCNLCNKMHHSNSPIGKLHNKYEGGI